jgi:hypothetical protein
MLKHPRYSHASPKRGKPHFLEQPSCHLFIEYLQTCQLPALGIRRTAQGIDMEELETTGVMEPK